MTSPLARRITAGIVAGFGLVLSGTAGAQQPLPWQTTFQEAATPVMANIERFNLLLTVIVVVIVLFVLGLLIWCVVRYNAKANPIPSKTTHHTWIEIAWTVLPVMILVAIALPSFRLLYYQEVIPEADLTVKATGNSWYWTYDYPDQGDFQVISNIVSDADLQEGQPRLFTVDNDMVVPVGQVVRVIVTASGVLHSFAVPSFGIKVDAVPGQLNETWFMAEREGMYYGQCSELCGVNHAFMPIGVRVVSEQDFAAWVGEQGGTMTPEADAEAAEGAAAPAADAVAPAAEAAPAGDPEETAPPQVDEAAPAPEAAPAGDAAQPPAETPADGATPPADGEAAPAAPAPAPAQ